METKNIEPRKKIVHCDWITLSGISSGKKGRYLLDAIRQAIGINNNEDYRSGKGKGWHFEQYSNIGLRLSTTDDGDARIEAQGLFFSGGVEEPFSNFLKMVGKVKEIKDTTWRLSRIDVAIDLYGVDIKSAFPDPNSDKYDFTFGYNQEDHKIKVRTKPPMITGYTIRKQRWKLTVYDKRQELLLKKQHPIKKAFYKLMTIFSEDFTRIELRINSAEALNHVQGILNSTTDEIDLCRAILKHWSRYHRVKTKNGKIEDRFNKLFCDFEVVKFERIERDVIKRIQEEHHEVELRDIFRKAIRYGFKYGNSASELNEIFQYQVKWLQETEGLHHIENSMAPKPEASTDPSGKGVS